LKYLGTILSSALIALSLHAQNTCGIRELAFRSPEELVYSVVYDWGPFWLESGHTTFRVRSGQHEGKRTFLLTGSGGTYPKYDWFFRVRDVFQVQVDSASFRPLKFEATMQEGSKDDRHIYFFNYPARQAYTIINRGKRSVEVDTVMTSPCTIDVLTAIYYARSIDFSGYRPNDTIGMSLLIDGEVFPIYIRYLGRDEYVSKTLGKFRCIKFSPLLVEGSIFKKGEDMKVWVTDDRNKVPLYVETPIIVGTVKVMLSRYKDLKYPLDARIQGQ
jgi:hypothetical protein